MSFQVPDTGALGEAPCRYGMSKLLFRGPERRLDDSYIAFLGGNETYGRFVDRPFVSLIDSRLDRDCINLGWPNIGLDLLLSDPELLRISARATTVVLQVPGAHSMSNRFYRVHPRRNDRFVQATRHLQRLFPEIDFTCVHFVRHLLISLFEADEARFRTVREELERRWIDRMRTVLRRLGGKVILLWLPRVAGQQTDSWANEPFLVTRRMMDDVAGLARDLVVCPVSSAAKANDMADMRFGELQQPMAEQMIGPETHRQIANHLLDVVTP